MPADDPGEEPAAPPAGEPDEATTPQGPSPAVPLLAKRIPERSLELRDDDPPAAPVPALAAAPPPIPAAVSRRPRSGGTAAAPGPQIGSRRLRRFDAPPGARALRPVALLVGAVLAGGVVLVVAYVLLGSGSSQTTHRPPSRPASSATLSGPLPSSVTVSVLNGTDRIGLAGKVSRSLRSLGFARGAVGDATQATVANTVVGYTKGHRAAALEVASALHLGATSVKALTGAGNAGASAGTGSSPVVVTLGANFRRAPSP